MDKKCSPLSVLLPHNRFRSPTKKDSRYVAYSRHIVSFPLNTNVCEYEPQYATICLSLHLPGYEFWAELPPVEGFG